MQALPLQFSAILSNVNGKSTKSPQVRPQFGHEDPIKENAEADAFVKNYQQEAADAVTEITGRSADETDLKPEGKFGILMPKEKRVQTSRN